MKNHILLIGLFFICKGMAGPMRRQSLLSSSQFISKRSVGKPPKNDNFNDLALANALFNYSDINRDYFLSPFELKALYLKFFNFSEHQAENISSKLVQLGDLDGDNQLNIGDDPGDEESPRYVQLTTTNLKHHLSIGFIEGQTLD